MKSKMPARASFRRRRLSSGFAASSASRRSSRPQRCIDNFPCDSLTVLAGVLQKVSQSHDSHIGSSDRYGRRLFPWAIYLSGSAVELVNDQVRFPTGVLALCHRLERWEQDELRGSRPRAAAGEVPDVDSSQAVGTGQVPVFGDAGVVSENAGTPVGSMDPWNICNPRTFRRPIC